MNRETRFKYCKKTIEVYEKAIQVLEKLKPVIKSFDGKVFTKRFEEALDTKANEGYEKREYLVSAKKTEYAYDVGLNISLHVYDNAVCEKNEYGSQQYNIDNDRYYIYTQMDSKRIEADKIIETINKKNDSIKKSIRLMKEGLETVSEMEKELQEMISHYTEYRNRYEKTSLLDVFDCNYELKNMTPFRFR